MSLKENTQKKRYSFKKGEKFCREKAGNKYLYNGATFIHEHSCHLRRYTFGSIDNEWNSQFQYYAETIEQYNEMNSLLLREKEKLFSEEMKQFIEHPLLINNDKNKEELEIIIDSIEYDSIKKKLIGCLIDIDEEKYPIISWIINNLKSRSKYREYQHEFGNCRVIDIKDELDVMINTIVRTNHSLKNFIRIMHPKDGEFIIRNNYIGKSEPADYDKNRKWRKRIETKRRRKERKDNKKQINQVMCTDY